MSSDASTNRILRADPIHGGVRFSVLITIIFGLLGGFILIRALLDWYAQGTLLYEFATAISCIFAIPFALIAGWLVERYLRKTWSSGLEFELAPHALKFQGGMTGEGIEDIRVIEFDKRVNLLRWYFKLGGYPKAGSERLVSDKWLCMASQMQQDGERIIVYTYVPPDKAQDWLDAHDLAEPYREISVANLYQKAGKRRWSASTRPDISSEWLAGPDGRYWIAERRRWEEGLELTQDDYAALMTYLEKNSLSDPDRM